MMLKQGSGKRTNLSVKPEMSMKLRLRPLDKPLSNRNVFVTNMLKSSLRKRLMRRHNVRLRLLLQRNLEQSTKQLRLSA